MDYAGLHPHAFVIVDYKPLLVDDCVSGRHPQRRVRLICRHIAHCSAADADDLT